MATFEETTTENIAIDPDLLDSLLFLRTLSDTAQIDPDLVQVKTSVRTLSETTSIAQTLIDRQSALLAETLGMAVTFKPDLGFTLVEAVPLSSTLITKTTYNTILSQAVATAESLIQGQGVTVSDFAQMAYMATAAESARVIEALGLGGVISPTTTFGLTLEQAFSLSDSLRNFFSGDFSETVGIAPALTPAMLMSSTTSEGVGVGEAATPNFILKVTAADTIELTPTELLNGIYSGIVLEDMEIGAAYLSPGGGVTTWAVNAITGATTEYSGYDFNSFAGSGHKYLGASSSGLYALDGDTDDGSDIIADLKSGFLQFTGSKFTQMGTAYLGTRGAGDFVFRLETGDGKTYDYAVAAKDMETTRIRMGKGLRTRYFSFELISAGQDFDLESVEFVPISSKRRV